MLVRHLAIILAFGFSACSSAKPAHAPRPDTDESSASDEPEVPWSELGPTNWPRHEGQTIKTKGYAFVALSICGRQRCEPNARCANVCNACNEYLSIASEKIPDEPRSDSWNNVPSLGLAGADPADFSCSKPSGSCERTCPLVVGAKYEIAGRFHDGIVYGVSFRRVRDDE